MLNISAIAKLSGIANQTGDIRKVRRVTRSLITLQRRQGAPLPACAGRVVMRAYATRASWRRCYKVGDNLPACFGIKL